MDKLESRLDGAEIGVGSVEKMVSNIIKHCGETSIQYELLQESIGNVTIEPRNSIKQISKAHQLILIFHFPQLDISREICRVIKKLGTKK
ncbi:hypothetical protein [Metabacillus idriensis]|uniref:hypothetical protein n=1 Tax=Metabacillus idriensis TaxID=324768 RepID=UPI00163A665A|nr:hypothetical protein [Metabacillus idriensis]QNG60180.1 hypothetical protein H4O14_01220 [Bacillus sp. PAMC26568]